MKRLFVAIIALISIGATAGPDESPTNKLNDEIWKVFVQDSEVQVHRKVLSTVISGQEGAVAAERELRLVRQNCGFVGCNETYLAIETYSTREGQANPIRESILALVYIGFTGEVESVEVIFPQTPPAP